MFTTITSKKPGVSIELTNRDWCLMLISVSRFSFILRKPFGEVNTRENPKKQKNSFLTHVQTSSKVRESYEGFEFLVDIPESTLTQLNLVRTGFFFAGSWRLDLRLLHPMSSDILGPKRDYVFVVNPSGSFLAVLTRRCLHMFTKSVWNSELGLTCITMRFIFLGDGCRCEWTNRPAMEENDTWSQLQPWERLERMIRLS